MTITKLAACLLLLVATALPCHAAMPTPEQIIEAFFGPSGIADKTAYYTGEMKALHSNDPTLGEGFVPGIGFTWRRLPLSPDGEPVYAVTIRHGDELFDWYAYFGLDNGSLKLRAVRTLGLSGISYELMKMLAQRRVRTDQQEWDYQNLRLAFLPDLERLAHLRNQLGELDALRAAIDARDDEAVKRRLRGLYLRGWEHNERGQIEIWIGGGLMNSVVGLLYVPPGESPPPIDETDHIYIEQVEGPWYVYKTT